MDDIPIPLPAVPTRFIDRFRGASALGIWPIAPKNLLQLGANRLGARLK